MTCHNCEIEMVKAGKFGKKAIQRFQCKQCGKRYSDPQDRPLGDVRLPQEKVQLILHCLVEGNSIRGTARLCGVEKRTVLNLLKTAGGNCERLLEKRLRSVPVKNLQLDEVWTFVFKKEQNKWMKEASNQRIGDAYTFIALERETKLILAWHLGKRNRPSTEAFIAKVRTATADRPFQLTTDGFPAYPPAIDYALADRADYAQLERCMGSRKRVGSDTLQGMF